MKQQLSGSSLLADASGLAKTVYGLTTDDFYSGDFIDFASIIEHGILGDIYLVPGGTAVPDAMLQPVRELIREGAIRLLDNRPPVMPLPRRNLHQPSTPDGIFNAKRSSAEDAKWEAARVAGAELALGRPGMLLTRQRSTYQELARPSDEHWVCDLMANHHRLTHALQAFRKQAAPPGYVLVRVPPFAHLVLSKAATFGEALELMLHYRQKCMPLRSAVDELFACLSSPDIGPLQKAEERDKFLASWDAMITACGQASTARMAFANSRAQFLRSASQVASAMLQFDIEDTFTNGRKSVSTFLELVGDEQWQHNHAWTLRPIRSAAREYLSSPDRAMRDAAHRIFGAPTNVVEARMRLLAKTLSVQRAA